MDIGQSVCQPALLVNIIELAGLYQRVADAEDKLRRHAAHHFWITDNIKHDYAKMIEQSQSVLNMVEAELEKK